MKKLTGEPTLEVFYQERGLTDVQKILMSPDRSPNFAGARDMGMNSNGGFDSLMDKLLAGVFSGAYIGAGVLVESQAELEPLRAALRSLAFLAAQYIPF